jgi:hypothetical protein
LAERILALPFGISIPVLDWWRSVSEEGYRARDAALDQAGCFNMCVWGGYAERHTP